MIGATAQRFFFAFGLLLAPNGLLAAPPASPLVEGDATNQLVVTWTSPDPVDVLVANDANAASAEARLVVAKDRDGRALVDNTLVPRTYVILRNARTGESVLVAPRLVPLEAGSNFRDIGGYPAAGGKHIVWGRIYRSGATPLLTSGDRSRIAALGLTNMVDLRSDEERALAPSRIDGVPYTAIGYSMMTGLDMSGGMESVYRALPTLMLPQLRQITTKLLRDETPLAYNCSAGQDRTGFVTAILLSALGTDRSTIVADYHLSTKYRRPEYEMPHLDPAAHPGDQVVALFAHFQSDPQASKPQPLMTAEGQPYLDFAFAEIDKKWGSVEGYLSKGLGLSEVDILKLRASYTR